MAAAIPGSIHHKRKDFRSCSVAVVGYRQVIVDCLGNAHETLRLVMSSRIIGQHLYGIHGVISACIEQTLNIMLLHDLKNQEDVIKDVSCKIPQGSVTALVGPGGGKGADGKTSAGLYHRDCPPPAIHRRRTVPAMVCMIRLCSYIPFKSPLNSY